MVTKSAQDSEDQVAVVRHPGSAAMTVAEAVRLEIYRQGIAQRDLGAALGHTQSWINRRLRGKVPFAVEDLMAVAKLLGVDVTQFLVPAA